MISRASIDDIEQIKNLIDYYSSKGLMLPKSLSELYENVRDFLVFKNKGKIIGCAALHVIWKDLAEIKSVAVKPRYKRRGIGSKLVKACVKEAKAIGLNRIFALTYVPEFFENQKFKKISKNSLPKKIWGECLKCVKFPNCDETAMMRELV